jgi:predicted NBD/HSP70 family sugar kinase
MTSQTTAFTDLASIHAARVPSHLRVYQALLEHGSSTRPEVADLTGLSLPAVSTAVDDLKTRGLVVEDGKRSGATGRRPRLVRLIPEENAVLAIDLGGERIRATLFDLYGSVLEAHDDISVGAFSRLTTDDRLDTLVKLVERFPKARAVGLSIPGTVQPDGTLWQSWLFGFESIALSDLLRKRINLPIRLENDANAAAWGEYKCGRGIGSCTMVFVTLGPAIGAGMIVDGKLHRGRHGMAGELALIAPNISSLESGDSRFGALAFSIYDGLREAAQFDITRADWMRDVFEAASRKEPKATAALEHVVRHLALALSGVIATLDPDLIVMRGELPHLEQLIVKPTKLHLERLRLRTSLQTSSLGGNAGALGVGLMVASSLETKLLEMSAR